jgi:hypothetical protein
MTGEKRVAPYRYLPCRARGSLLSEDDWVPPGLVSAISRFRFPRFRDFAIYPGFG